MHDAFILFQCIKNKWKTLHNIRNVIRLASQNYMQHNNNIIFVRNIKKLNIIINHVYYVALVLDANLMRFFILCDFFVCERLNTHIFMHLDKLHECMHLFYISHIQFYIYLYNVRSVENSLINLHACLKHR